MIVTKKFVFIHLERTAGNFFAGFLKAFFPPCAEIGYHYPRKLLPPSYRKLPLIGFARNPWDWYVSFYHHKAAIGMPGFEKLGFEELTRALVYMNRDERRHLDFKFKFMMNCPGSIAENRSMGITRKELHEFRETGMGFYSWLFRRMFADERGDLRGVHFGRYEHLEEDTKGFLRNLGIEFTEEMEKYFRSPSKRIKASRRADYKTYYPAADLRLAVPRQERLLVDLFGYRFGRGG